MNYKFLKLFFVTVLFLISKISNACQCPLTELSIKECDKYEIIFKGKIISVTPCDNKFGIAIFEIDELYKGNATKQFKVLFECGVECAQEFSEGEEWIIYSTYKQIDKAVMNWCSRSRKYFKNDKEDFYAVTYGNDYYEEASFLKKNLGLHRLLAQTSNAAEERNLIPSKSQTIMLLLSSLLVIFLFYWLFKKYFKF
ncbi:MAG: hypothetical protein Q7W45_13365 [Bacteroidota bacterium]|nr:hypothetical protein [Bacteroidota bacterium]MDP3144490.1 hypothetical protein [Bacteroidota bacterium]